MAIFLNPLPRTQCLVLHRYSRNTSGMTKDFMLTRLLYAAEEFPKQESLEGFAVNISRQLLHFFLFK